MCCGPMTAGSTSRHWPTSCATRGRNIPRSLILGIATLIAVYLGMTLAYHFVLLLSEVAAANKKEGDIENAVAAVYCRQLLGGAGVVAISLLVMCSTFLSLYASAVCSRIAYSDQKRGSSPN